MLKLEVSAVPIVTVKLAVAVFPEVSVAVHVIVVTPSDHPELELGWSP